MLRQERWDQEPALVAESHEPLSVDEEKMDDMVLALLYLTTFEDKPRLRAWKGHNWDVLDRLHRKEDISDPATKAKSVLLAEAGAKRSQELFEKYFTK